MFTIDTLYGEVANVYDTLFGEVANVYDRYTVRRGREL